MGEAHKSVCFVAVPAPDRPSPPRQFTALGLVGHELQRDKNGNWARCSGDEDFADYLEAQARFRGWFMSTTQRKGVPCQMRRPARPPFEVLIISSSPWLSEWTKDELIAGRNPREKLAKIRNDWLEYAEAQLEGKRHLIGFACHTDTDDLHFDFILTRQDGVGGQIGGQGLYVAGDWTVGATRQVRAGATVSDEKARRIRHNIDTFHARYGAEATPLDILLSRSLDGFADEVIGAPLKAYKERYAASVPGLEREHKAAEIAALDAAKALLTADDQTPPVPHPDKSSPPAPLDL